jgi:hypothetical protein
MSEWLKEHAWKTIPATLTESYCNTSSRNRFNDVPLQNTSRCEPVTVDVCQRFWGDLTQFLHSSQLHLLVYEPVFVNVDRRMRRRRVKPDYRVYSGLLNRWLVGLMVRHGLGFARSFAIGINLDG